MRPSLSVRGRQAINTFFQNLRTRIAGFVDDFDLASLPSFVIFLVVVTVGVSVNYFFLITNVQMDWRPAMFISMLFEFGILAWKFQGHRVKNSNTQREVVTWATWLSVMAAFAMVIASLTQLYSWAYPVVFAFVVHLVAYLIYDNNDDIRENRRANKMADERIKQKQLQVDNAIAEAEADLKIIDKITQKLSDLHMQYSHLPPAELEFVLEETRLRLLKEYKASANVRNKTSKLADLNNDGIIGPPSEPSF